MGTLEISKCTSLRIREGGLRFCQRLPVWPCLTYLSPHVSDSPLVSRSEACVSCHRFAGAIFTIFIHSLTCFLKRERGNRDAKTEKGFFAAIWNALHLEDLLLFCLVGVSRIFLEGGVVWFSVPFGGVCVVVGLGFFLILSARNKTMLGLFQVFQRPFLTCWNSICVPPRESHWKTNPTLSGTCRCICRHLTAQTASTV